MLLVGINATLTLLIILRMSWVISFFLSLSELDSLTCFSAIVQLSFSLSLSFSDSLFTFHSCSASVSHSLICIFPFHKHTDSFTPLNPPPPPALTVGLSLSLSLIRYKAMLVHLALALRPDMLIKAWLPLKPISGLLFYLWNIQHLQLPVLVYAMDICVCQKWVRHRD